MGWFSSHPPPEQSKTYLDDRGYYRFTDSHDLVHCWVAKVKKGRKLKKDEVVHHLNHNKRHNSESNLHMCANQQEHERIHELDKIYGRGKGINYLHKDINYRRKEGIFDRPVGLLIGLLLLIAVFVLLQLMSRL